MNPPRGLFFLALLIFFLPFDLLSETLPPPWAKYLERVERASTLELRFFQSYRSGIEKESVEGSGQAYYRQGSWRWDYKGLETRSYLLPEGKAYQIEGDEVEELELSEESFNRTILDMISRPREFLNSRRFRVKGSLLEVDGEKNDEFERGELRFQGGELRELSIALKNGDRIKLRIDKLTVGLPLSRSLFQIPQET